MKEQQKKIISLFLIFSLVMLSANLYAKERRGAKLIITKLDGQLIEGELITVKPNSLLLLDTEGKGVSVDIGDIKVIRIVKKSKAGTGALIGLVVGGGGGALLALVNNAGHEPYTIKTRTWIAGILGGLGGLLIGAMLGVGEGTDETIQIEGMTDSEIQETMDKLRKKARIRGYK